MDCADLKQEVAKLPADARIQLRHRLRNGLQTIIMTVETEPKEASMDAVMELGEDLRRLGL